VLQFHPSDQRFLYVAFEERRERVQQGVRAGKAQSSRTVRRTSRGLRAANSSEVIATELWVRRMHAARRAARAHTSIAAVVSNIWEEPHSPKR
jgi:hypothetical protein